MRYGYDINGWFIGQVAEDDPRSTDTPPPQAEHPMMANWQGNYWFVAKYTPPPVPQEPSEEDPVAKLLADPELVARLKAALS